MADRRFALLNKIVGAVKEAAVTAHEAALSIAGEQIDSGTVADARLSSNIPLLSAALNTFSGDIYLSGDNEEIRFGVGNDGQIFSDGASLQIVAPVGIVLDARPNGSIVVFNNIKIAERSAADNTSAGFGQIWVKNTTPAQLWFTDDAGTDTRIV